jgi:hypothetical protein
MTDANIERLAARQAALAQHSADVKRQIVDLLRSGGHQVDDQLDKVDGIHIWFSLTPERHHTGLFKYEFTGSLRMKFGRPVQQFPEPKCGFDIYDKAHRIKMYVVIEKNKQEVAARRAGLKVQFEQAAERLARKHSLSTLYDIHSCSSGLTIHLANLSEADADEILGYLTQKGWSHHISHN